ncbi:MAG: hypothetical protein IKF14_01555 [Atopobiaceae bacterium]|nr:hypothetical protein [Atopobiaceae bacterium]
MAEYTIKINSSEAGNISRDLSALRETVRGQISSLNSTCMGVTEGATATALLQMAQTAKMVGEALVSCIDETDGWLKKTVEQYKDADAAAATGFAHAGSGASSGEDG